MDQRPLLAEFSDDPRMARKAFVHFVKSRVQQGKRDEFYKSKDQPVLGSEDFLEEVQEKLGGEAIGAMSFRFQRSFPGSFPNLEYPRDCFMVKIGIERDPLGVGSLGIWRGSWQDIL